MSKKHFRLGYLYLKDDGRYFKIGKTVDPSRREKEYVTENLSLRKLDEMVFSSPRQMTDMEADFLRMTEKYSVKNCNGNSTEWRERTAEVIHAWIEFKEKHSLLNVAVWEDKKKDLLGKAASLHKTQLHTAEQLEAAESRAASDRWAASDAMRRANVADSEAKAAQALWKTAEASRKKLQAEVTECRAQIRDLNHRSEEALNEERCKRLSLELAAKETEERLKKQAHDLWVRREAEHKMSIDLANNEIKQLKAASSFSKAEHTFSGAINGCKDFAQSVTQCELTDSPEDTFAAVALAFSSVSAVAVVCFLCLLFSL